MGTISTNEFKSGITVKMDGDLYVIIEYQHVKPGKGGAFVRTKLRKMKTGGVIERTFRVGEKFEDAFIEQRTLQYQYRAGDAFHFMDTTTYEDVTIKEDFIGPAGGFLKESMECEGRFYENQLISLELPTFVELHVAETEPGIRGDTSKSGNKPAKLESGASIMVPLFVDAGDLLKIDTRTGAYVGRA